MDIAAIATDLLWSIGYGAFARDGYAGCHPADRSRISPARIDQGYQHRGQAVAPIGTGPWIVESHDRTNTVLIAERAAGAGADGEMSHESPMTLA